MVGTWPFVTNALWSTQTSNQRVYAHKSVKSNRYISVYMLIVNSGILITDSYFYVVSNELQRTLKISAWSDQINVMCANECG